MFDHLDVRIVVFSLQHEQLQVLLRPAEAGRWELPGCPLPGDQSLEEAAARSIYDLVGLREPYLEQLYTYGDTGRIDRGSRWISVVYFAILPSGTGYTTPETPQSKDAQLAQWFPVDHLPPLALDHGEVIGYALRRLRYKLEYTAIGFQLLPETFSLSELQKVYEMILGEKLDKRNFRRRILQAGIIEETSTRRAGEGRPARLYRYRPDAVAEIKARRLFP